jgi:hypothetical protein
MTSREAMQFFSFKFLFLREWKWLLTIIVTSLVWIVSTYMSAAQTLAQVKLNTPKIEKLQEKCIEYDKYIAINNERWEHVKESLEWIKKKVE